MGVGRGGRAFTGSVECERGGWGGGGGRGKDEDAIESAALFCLFAFFPFFSPFLSVPASAHTKEHGQESQPEPQKIQPKTRRRSLSPSKVAHLARRSTSPVREPSAALQPAENKRAISTLEAKELQRRLTVRCVAARQRPISSWRRCSSPSLLEPVEECSAERLSKDLSNLGHEKRREEVGREDERSVVGEIIFELFDCEEVESLRGGLVDFALRF